jgi:hypothetical protein
MRRRGVLALPFALLAARPARAADLAVRTTGLHRTGGKLGVSVGVTDIIRFDDPRLTSGFANRVLIRVALFREGTRQAVATTYRLADIVYDLWEEKFRVQRKDARGVLDQRDAATAKVAVELAANLIRFPITDLSRLVAGERYRLSFSTDLNPISQDVVTELRRWLARPPGQGRLAPGDSFFGSFVSIFVNPHIEDSDRRVQFISQSWQEPRR